MGVFTTVLVKDGCPVWAAEHVRRVLASARELGLVKSEVAEEEIMAALFSWPKVNRVVEGASRVYIWRENGSPRMIVTGQAMALAPAGPHRLGLAATPRHSADPTVRHKTVNRLLLEWEREKGEKSGFTDVIFVNERGEITETSRSNLFFVREGSLFTPQDDCGLLPGIGREKVAQLCRKEGLDLTCGRFFLPDLMKADEVFTVNSLRGIVPAAIVGERELSDERPVTDCLSSAYRRLVSDYVRTHIPAS